MKPPPQLSTWFMNDLLTEIAFIKILRTRFFYLQWQLHVCDHVIKFALLVYETYKQLTQGH